MPRRVRWRRVVAVGVVVATLAVAALRRPAAASRPPASAAPPAQLAETGLYATDGSIDGANRAFAPQYPLWTDGATKRRWVRLPEGATIDARDPDAWRFPAGTTFWKEFAWNGRPVETRMIRIRADGGADYATYVWNTAGSEAQLAPATGIARSYEIAPGRWHAVPSTADCANCHESGPSRILGFSALQLSDDRDPLAPHAEPLPEGALTLRRLLAEQRLRPRHAAWASAAPRIHARDSIERAALGYLSINCGSCHNTSGPLARLGFALGPDIAAAVRHSARFALPGDTVGARLIAAGLPDASAVVHRMQSRRPSTQMPPLGSVVVDSAGVALVRRWIASLR